MSPRRLAAAAVTLVALLATAGCGDPPVTRDEFIEQLRSITSGVDEATPELAGCIYDRISDDEDLLEAASSGADLPKEQEERLEGITSDCWERVNAPEDPEDGGDDGDREDGDRTTTTTSRSGRDDDS